MLTSFSPEVTSNELNKALADSDHATAKRMLCVRRLFSESECNATQGSSMTIADVVNVLIRKKQENHGAVITNQHVRDAKQGNIGINNKGRFKHKTSFK